MSFWSFLFRKPTTTAAVSIDPEQRPSFTAADREFVRAALRQFEANGLRIRSGLDRDLISVRALIDIGLWRPDDQMPGDDLLSLFLVLANGTDSLTWYI